MKMMMSEGFDEIKLYCCDNFSASEADFEGDPAGDFCSNCGQCQKCHDHRPEWYEACEECGDFCCQREMIDDDKRLCPECYGNKYDPNSGNKDKGTKYLLHNKEGK